MPRRLAVGIATITSALGACRSRSHDDARGAPSVETAVGFEAIAGLPQGWAANPAETVAVDGEVAHTGYRAARIVRGADSPEAFSSLSRRDSLAGAGSMIELRGFLRTQDVRGFAGLWLREDGESQRLAFDNMHERELAGTTGWSQYSISLPIQPEATDVVWGVLLVGDGKVWADDLELLVDGKPISQAPPGTRPTTALDRDHAFDHGSGIALARPTAQQVANLVLLGKVWGFLKYHHPVITAGQRHWDYDLLRELPAILAATDRAAAEAALVHWIEGLGALAPCQPCARLDTKDLAVAPDLGWLDDRRAIGPELSRALHAVYAARPAGQQFFVELAIGIGNPVFRHEPDYRDVMLPDAGFQLLALYRLWNIVEYWAPDRALADDWNRVLVELVPEVLSAATPEAYGRAMLAAIVRLRDGHAHLSRAEDVQPPEGACSLPVDIRFVEQRPIVTGGTAGELEVGDEITDLDGVAVAELVARWRPFYPASNDAARLRDIARAMTRGPCGNVTLGISRADRSLRVAMTRTRHGGRRNDTHDLEGDTFRLLSDEVAYLKLSSVRVADLAHDIEQAMTTKGLIVDIRNYPSAFVVFALGSLLVTRPVSFVLFTSGDLSNPGAFHWTAPIELSPGGDKPHYPGKVVVLVDEVSQSQAEYTAMALRAGPRTTVVGSPTAGADGNVSEISLPGGLATALSGLGVFYPDRRPTQGIGIVPDVTVAPTIAGIRARRDEALDAAIRLITAAR